MSAESVQPLVAPEEKTPESRWPEPIQKWDYIIVPVAEQYMMDPDLIRAVIYVESYGRELVVSKSGACGLMQVMARDSSQVRPWLFRDRPTCAELKDPEFNIRWGVQYLATLYHVWGDDWREALMHYGPLYRGYEYADQIIALWHEGE